MPAKDHGRDKEAWDAAGRCSHDGDMHARRGSELGQQRLGQNRPSTRKRSSQRSAIAIGVPGRFEQRIFYVAPSVLSSRLSPGSSTKSRDAGRGGGRGDTLSRQLCSRSHTVTSMTRGCSARHPVLICHGSTVCTCSYFAHVRPCAQGRCGRCPPGSGVMFCLVAVEIVFADRRSQTRCDDRAVMTGCTINCRRCIVARSCTSNWLGSEPTSALLFHSTLCLSLIAVKAGREATSRTVTGFGAFTHRTHMQNVNNLLAIATCRFIALTIAPINWRLRASECML